MSFFVLQERLSHGISASGFPGNHRTSDFQPPYFPPHFPSQQPTPQEVFAAQNAHLADPYTNSLHSFQTSQVRHQLQEKKTFLFTFGSFSGQYACRF